MRSFWNGLKGTSGPISEAWNVSGWPTLYVIDRAKSVGFDQELIDGAIERWVAIAEKGQREH